MWISRESIKMVCRKYSPVSPWFLMPSYFLVMLPRVVQTHAPARLPKKRAIGKEKLDKRPSLPGWTGPNTPALTVSAFSGIEPVVIDFWFKNGYSSPGLFDCSKGFLGWDGDYWKGAFSVLWTLEFIGVFPTTWNCQLHESTVAPLHIHFVLSLHAGAWHYWPWHKRQKPLAWPVPPCIGQSATAVFRWFPDQTVTKGLIPVNCSVFSERYKAQQNPKDNKRQQKTTRDTERRCAVECAYWCTGTGKCATQEWDTSKQGTGNQTAGCSESGTTGRAEGQT